MADRPDFGYPPMNMVYSPAQWNNGPNQTSQYSPSAAYYPATSYTAPQGNSGRPMGSLYNSSTKPQSPDLMNQSTQYASYPPTPNRSPPITAQQHQMYAHPAQPQPQPLRHPLVPPRPHTMSTYPPTMVHPSPVMTPPHSPPQYNHVQPISNESQYPASPSRPFSCDMCALSFNRQHDLKRHRETHSGEKPFLCNGGCGKTFTRKDALKRHQVS